MEMQQVRYFLALSRTLNFTRAAEECNVSQPSLTRAIRMLEEELGGELLRRERTQSHLTELGQRMLPLLRQCYEGAQSAKSLATSIKKNEVAPLALAISETIGIDLLTGPLVQLRRAYPGLQLKVIRGDAEEIEALLKEGRVELAVAGPLGELWERLDAWTLFEEGFQLVLGTDHALAPRSEIELPDIAGETLFLHTACEMAGAAAERLGAHREARSVHEVRAAGDIGALVGANLGIAVLPTSLARAIRASARPLSGFELRRTLAVYAVAGRRRSAAAGSFLNLLRAMDWSTQPS
jgi:DNA-binding transcriptional LysR family regulator